MRKLFFPLLYCLITLTASAQKDDRNARSPRQSIAIKAGLNFNYMSALKDFNSSNSMGFVIGGYFSPPSQGLFGFRSELLFSRQGYDYQNNRKTGSVMLDYLMLPQLTTFNITRFVQLHAGAQIAVLLNAKVDSSASPSSAPADPSRPKDYFNKINYGFAGGLELHPVAGLFIGGRYNLFFDMLRDQSATTNAPSYIPSYGGNLKNGIVQVYLGYKF